MKTHDDRSILGKNGRGRLGLFSFSDNYTLSTSKDGEINSFKVMRSTETFAKLKKIVSLKQPFKNENGLYNDGTYIKCHINDNYVELDDLKETINLRFGADSTFNIYINNEKVDLFDFKDNCDCEEIYYENDKSKPIKIYLISKDQYNKKLSTYEVVWWVKNRYVEHDKWKDLGIDLDSRNHRENKFVFLVCADFLENYVESDWTGFKDDNIIVNVKNLVSNKINEMMGDITLTNKKERKKYILSKSINEIKNLNPIEQHEIGSVLEELLVKCNHLNDDDLSNILTVITTLESSNKKFEFFEKLANLNEDEFDKLTEIIDKWSINDAYLVLNELYQRLELIKKIDLICDNPDTREVQQLQPLFKQGLWIFHPKYEGTTRFTSNQTMNKVLVDLLGVENYVSENAKKRQDFVVLEDSTISTYTSDYYVDDSEVVDGYDEILIIELKKGGSKIRSKEKYQALDYAREIMEKSPNVKHVTAYVLGTNIDFKYMNPIREGNIKIYPKQYRSVIETAKKRTFNLISKIQNVKGITDFGDVEVNEVLKENEVQTILSE